MGKFKVGDIVIPNIQARRYGVTNLDMIEAKVISSDGDKIQIKIIDHLDKKYIGRYYFVNVECFDLCEKIVIYRKGNTVIATDKSTGKTAHATCMESDTFNLADGQKLAFYRLMGMPEEKIREMLTHMFKKKEIEKPFVIKQDHYNVGDKVLIVDKFTPECDEDSYGLMTKYCGKTMTIRGVVEKLGYKMEEDKEIFFGFLWNNHCIAGKIIEGVKKVKRAAKAGEYVLIVNPFETNGNYEKGDIIRISSVGNDRNARYGNDCGKMLYEYEYIVLEGYKPEMQDKIKIGDKVEIFDLGQVYREFAGWKGLVGYKQNFVMKSKPSRSEHYKVLRIETHHAGSKKILALIQNPKTTQVFIIGVDGLRKVGK